MQEPAANELEQLRSALAQRGVDYALLSPLPDTQAHARFIGRFENREVVWDMRLYTLERYENERGGVPDTALRGLMQIAPSTDHVHQLEVALNVPLIDEPTLKKTIVMMRNYKQLRLGLRTWGNQLGSESHGTTLSYARVGNAKQEVNEKRLRASRCKMVVSNVTINTRRISHV